MDVHDHISEIGDVTWIQHDYKNSNGYKQRGAELSFAQNINDDWSYDLGYAFIHRDTDAGNEETRVHYRLPKNSYKAGIHYKHGIWKANLLAMMGSSSNGDHYVDKDFAVLDLNASCDVADFATIYIKFLNFSNQGYSYYGKYSLQEPGRAFIAGLDCKF